MHKIRQPYYYSQIPFSGFHFVFSVPLSCILDALQTIVHNITTNQEAWLKFLTEDNPEKIVQFVNQYPEFLPYYQDIITFRKKPEELIHMFSDALREMDRNTERYMVEELNKQVEDLKESVAEKKHKDCGEKCSAYSEGFFD